MKEGRRRAGGRWFQRLHRLHSLSWHNFFFHFAYPDACSVRRRLSRSFYCCFWCCLIGGCMASEHIDERRDGRNNTNTHTQNDTENIMLQMHEITKCEFFFLLLLLFSCPGAVRRVHVPNWRRIFVAAVLVHVFLLLLSTFFFGYGVISSSYFRLI